ncbi:hypothetical protein Sjap_005243 [Stephania japonica]|uniref:Bet v I/Major latex protein domain-containing protein n=1 Tax=Stephania japonica TaxID=461633 RepID=A0AAP0K4R5_9MAGN
MAPVEKLELEREVSCPADKFYEFMKKDAAQLPQILPEYYKSCELLHGDGKSVGTIRLWKYTLGGPEVLVAKETIKSIDDRNKTVTYSIFEGDLKRMYKSFDIVLEVVPKVTKGEGRRSSTEELLQTPLAISTLGGRLEFFEITHLRKA